MNIKINIYATIILLLISHSLTAKADDTADIIRVYTHGETKLAFKNPDGSITGEAIDILTCVMDKLDRKYTLSLAPLSRAASILKNSNSAIWFPSKFEGKPERLAQLAGPAGSVTFKWHMNKDSQLDPNSPDFHKRAKITTFSGSRMIGWLKENGYNYVSGSADPNRLVYMLVSHEVDAILSVQLGESASASVKKQIEDNIKSIPQHTDSTAFHFSADLIKNQPDFIEKFRLEMKTCS